MRYSPPRSTAINEGTALPIIGYLAYKQQIKQTQSARWLQNKLGHSLKVCIFTPMDYLWHYDSPLGGMTMVSDGQALTALQFDRPRASSEEIDARPEMHRLPIFDNTCRWLDHYFRGQVPDFTPALALRGTPFRQAVWGILLTIPYGQTLSYGEIAARLATPRMSAQAVGGAVGHNPVAIIVPCHRVIGADGSLTGYAAGLDKKRRLLQLEQIIK